MTEINIFNFEQATNIEDTSEKKVNTKDSTAIFQTNDKKEPINNQSLGLSIQNTNNQNKSKTEKEETPKTSSTKKAKDDFEVNELTIIRYQGKSTKLTSLFTIEQIKNGIVVKGKTRKINKEDIIKALEVNHVEIDKTTARIFFHKEKNLLIPTIIGEKNGIVDDIEPFENSNSVEVYQSKIVKNRLYLSKEEELLKVRIPEELLYHFIKIARGFSTKYGTEVKAEIYFDLRTNKYKMLIPSQQVSRELIIVEEYTLDEVLEFMEMIKVMEIHSHHVFPAIPSSIDEKFDRSCGIYYAIIGNINNVFPDITVRILDYKTQQHHFIDAAEIITKDEIKAELFSQVIVEGNYE